MSELNHSTSRTTAPTQAPGATPAAGDGAAEVYRRAVQARPTGFTEDPLGAMASAMDRIGKSAAKVVAGRAMEGQDGLAQLESRLKASVAAMKANPGSLQAKQEAMASALTLLKGMQGLAPNDPRRVKVSQFIVRLANQLGAQGLQLQLPGLDARGLLRMAALTVSRYGGGAEMQMAFALEGLLKASMPQSSPEAIKLLTELMRRFGLSKEAQATLTNTWGVRLANPGEVPKVDISARTLVLDQAQSNPSLGVMARAFWHDETMKSPEHRNGFVEAFRKIASQSSFALLGRKYREVRTMARRELAESRVANLGARGDAPATTGGQAIDESSEMFAALAVFSSAEEGVELPAELAESVERFYG